jgi:hypothetical protein
MDEPMKALTLTQPWASLMAAKAKRIETRSWQTKYRGPLAIHAAKGFPRDCRDLVAGHPFISALDGRSWKDLPRSRVLCIVNLIGCFRTDDELHKAAFMLGVERLPLAELSFGDYRRGRYAWATEFVELVEDPGPTTGALSLWDWVRGPKPEAVRQAIAERAYDRGETTL